MIDHITVYPHRPLKVGGRLDERMQVEVWRDRLEGCTGPGGGHGEQFGKQDGVFSVTFPRLEVLDSRIIPPGECHRSERRRQGM